MNALYSDGTKLERQFSENMERVLVRTSKYKVHHCIIMDLMKYFLILVFALMFLESVLAAISADPSDVVNSRRASATRILVGLMFDV